MKTQRQTQVIIVGGGIAGLTLACLLANNGIHSVIIDKTPNFPYSEKDHGGRTAALMQQGIAILKKTGIWEELSSKTAALKTMRIIDDSSQKAEPTDIRFDASEIGHEEFGFNIPNNLLRAHLFQKAEISDHIKMMVPNTLQGIKHYSNKIAVTLDNEEEITANLIIGADGRFSKTRDLFNTGYKEVDYQQGALTCLIEHSKDHENISTEHHRPGGPFTLVPMPSKNGKHYSSIVWVEKIEDAEKFYALDIESFEQALMDRGQHIAGTIKLVSTPEIWPLKAILANQITGSRMALIAEAAHAMSPIGAQGLNLSMRDIDSIATIIVDALKRGEDIGHDLVLNRYAKDRRFDIDSRFYGVDQYNKIVSNNIGLLRGIRRTGLKTLNTIPALKKIAMTIGLSANQKDRAA